MFVAGLATDYCVKNTVLDARRLGFEATVVEDAVRGIEVEPGDTERALEEMRRGGRRLHDVRGAAGRKGAERGPDVVRRAGTAQLLARDARHSS